MKKKGLFLFLSAIIAFSFTFTPFASARSVDMLGDINEEFIRSVDPFITLEGNAFSLSEKAYSSLDAATIKTVESMLAEKNKLISEYPEGLVQQGNELVYQPVGADGQIQSSSIYRSLGNGTVIIFTSRIKL